MAFIFVSPQTFNPSSGQVAVVSESFEFFIPTATPPVQGSLDGVDVLAFANGSNQSVIWDLMPVPGSEDVSLIIDLHYRMSIANPGTVKIRITPIVDGVPQAPIDQIFNPNDAAWKNQSIVALNAAQYLQNSGIRLQIERRGTEDTHPGTFNIDLVRARY